MMECVCPGDACCKCEERGLCICVPARRWLERPVPPASRADRYDSLRCVHGVSMARACLLCAHEQVGLIPTRTIR
jgi:hypothetical protein